jgi:DNA-binding phage protein
LATFDDGDPALIGEVDRARGKAQIAKDAGLAAIAAWQRGG